MIGPSSSHTAGAARIGLAARLLLGGAISKAVIELHGSFAATGKGHASDRALVAGLLGMGAEDARLKDSMEIASKMGLDVCFEEKDLGDEAHPNSVRIFAAHGDISDLKLTASSIGGGMIKITELDGFETGIRGELDTVVIWNLDQPGYLAKITTLYECTGLNIASIRLSRSSRGASALTVIESDGPLPGEAEKLIQRIPATQCLRCLQPGWHPPNA